MADIASDLVATYEMLLESHGDKPVIARVAGIDEPLSVHKLEQAHGEFVIVHSPDGRTVALASAIVLRFGA